jgi:hypothetical protein
MRNNAVWYELHIFLPILPIPSRNYSSDLKVDEETTSYFFSQSLIVASLSVDDEDQEVETIEVRDGGAEPGWQ